MAGTIQETFALDGERRCWTVDEYYRAGELAIFGPDERLELIEGEIVSKTTPMSSRHAFGIRASASVLETVFDAGFDVRAQLPLVLGPHNEPEPDVAVVAGTFYDYVAAHPSTAVLLVEVSDSTLRTDRGIKASLYARAGIAEYWIVNLVDGVLEVYRQPAPMPSQPLGWGYLSVTRHTHGDSVSPVAAANQSVAVTDLLPPRST